MTTDQMPIRVGIIGLSKAASWAGRAHVKPISQLPEYYKLTALLVSRAESAAESAAAFGVTGYHGDPAQIAADPNVDLVVISVKALHHKASVLPAITAGKDVFSEWPLGANLVEAEELAALAREKGVRTMVGLQARNTAVAVKIKELLDSGVIGKVTSTTLIGASFGSPMKTNSANEVYADAKNGSTLLTIFVAHALDSMNYFLGSFKSISAAVRTQYPLVHNTETGKDVKKTAPDQVAINGELEGGVVATVHFKSTASKGAAGLYWEIVGEEGSIVLKGAMGVLQFTPPTLLLNGEELAYPEDPLGPVGREYEAFAKGDKSGYVDFDHALQMHRVIDAIERSSRDGVRVDF